jgi:FkbM family methyltransferase
MSGVSHGTIKKALQKYWNTTKSTLVDINYHGILMRCSIGTNTIEGKIVFSSKLREKNELKLLKPYLENGGVFIDIGANVGYYSLMAAKLGATKILSFEPNKTVRDRLASNRDFNDFQNIIDILPFALGMKKHSATMTVSSDDLGAGTLVPNCVEGESFTVPVERIDDVLAEKNVDQIDALKIDVEGYEYEALFPLLSCPTSLQPRCIIIEHAHSEIWEKDIIKILLENGYSKIGHSRSNTYLKYADF